LGVSYPQDGSKTFFRICGAWRLRYYQKAAHPQSKPNVIEPYVHNPRLWIVHGRLNPYIAWCNLKANSKRMKNFRGLLSLVLALFAFILLALLVWGVGPTLACAFPSNSSPQAGTNAYRIDSEGGQRCYLLYLPPNFEPKRPLPLIMSLHGFASNPHGQRTFSQWSGVAAEVYAAVVYPQATGFPHRWNADPAFGATGADDVQFIRDLIDHLSVQLPIDREQIFITGFSNGGAMTLRLGCELGTQVAAIGVVSAPVTPSLSSCKSERPIPLIAFHGTLDALVPYEGRTREDWGTPLFGMVNIPTPTLNPVDEWIEQWAQNNGCDAEAKQQKVSDEVTSNTFPNCSPGAEVIYYRIEGGGHTWPGGRKVPMVGAQTEDISASESMWDFFEEHPLR
jgi:polyhydroxybutyrate depolymerase